MDLGLRECTVKLFESTKDDHCECLDTRSRPLQYSELVFDVLLTGGIVIYSRQCTIELIYRSKD